MAQERGDDARTTEHEATHERQRRLVAELRAERERLRETERRLRAELRRLRARSGPTPR
jgi:hypothetical protein